MEVEVALEEVEGHLDVPPPGVCHRDVPHAELRGVQDTGQEGAGGAPGPELDQADRVGGPGGLVGAEPDDAVGDRAVAGGVEHLAGDRGGAGTAAGEPVVAGADDMVEPGVGDVPHVGDDQGAGREGLEEGTGVHGLALAGVGEVVDVEELLGAEVEGAGQLAGEEAPVTGGEGTQGGEATGDAIEGGLVQGDDAGGPGDEWGEGREERGEAGGEQGGDGGEHGADGGAVIVGDALGDGLVGDGEAGEPPEAGAGEEAPGAGDGGGATQDADEEAGPQGEGGEDAGSPACGDRVGCHAGDEVVQDGLDLVEGDVTRCAGHRRERGGYGVLRAS